MFKILNTNVAQRGMARERIRAGQQGMTFDIGQKLRQVRRQHGLSQRELAARAGLTNGAISLIEQNKTSPSVASLKRILDAIPMTMAEFFSEVEDGAPPRYFFSASEFTELSPQSRGMNGASAGVSLRQVGPAEPGVRLQMLHETYPPGADTGPQMLSHTGEEAGVVIAGIIEVTVDGQSRVLNPGDGYRFDSSLPHRFRNIGEEPCVIVSACTPPSF